MVDYSMNFSKCFLCQSDDLSDLVDPRPRKWSHDTQYQPYNKVSNQALQWEPVKEQYPFNSGYDCHVNIPLEFKSSFKYYTGGFVKRLIIS